VEAAMNTANLPVSLADRNLAANGAIMMLLGLVSGFTPAFSHAPRAALSAHTIGVLQAATLFGLAAIWPLLGSGRVVMVARYCALIGFYANWLGVQLAAFWSAKGMFIVNGSAMPSGAARWQEAIVAVLLNLSILIVVMGILVLWALYARRKTAG
jgi:(hydroxyamino)benzene mutase